MRRAVLSGGLPVILAAFSGVHRAVLSGGLPAIFRRIFPGFIVLFLVGGALITRGVGSGRHNLVLQAKNCHFYLEP